MNKTLLLIIVDFLFLNLIALTRWEKVEPARAQLAPVPAAAANAPTADQDLAATMRQQLADEQSTRQALEEKLTQADSTLSARDQGIGELQTERTRLSAQLAESQRSAAELDRVAQASREEAALSQSQLAQLQRELEERRAEVERQRKALDGLQAEQANARKQIEVLTTAVVVDEADKQHLQEQTAQLQTQVQVERAERAQVQASTERLAQGVGELAQNSGELTKEIRDNQPINANVLYNAFLANRVQTRFSATRRGLFGQVNPVKTTPTVLVTTGKQVYALLHLDDTVFSIFEPNHDWERIAVSFEGLPAPLNQASQLLFLNADPRIVALPLDAAQVAALGVKVYPLAADPFKFPDAVLIGAGEGKGYGELTFKLDPALPGYVRVDSHFFRRIFGDFSPARGDLVFSHTGELLGIMVNRDYCALIRNFTPAASLSAGDQTPDEHPAQTLDQVAARVLALPPQLQ